VGNGGSGAAALIYSNNASADAKVAVKEWDPGTFTGEMMKFTNGTIALLGGTFTGGASAKGLEITAGTVRAQGMRISTLANSSSNPVTKSGGTLVLDACTLVAEGASDSIKSGTAQNVKVYNGIATNRAKNANITIQVGTLSADSNVS
jgi:hypothetical protein